MSDGEGKVFEFPRCWEDDVRMNSLFSPFRARAINPTNWDSKMKFWESLIEQWCTWHKAAIIDLSSLASNFQRKGKVPSCIPEVVENLSRGKTLVTKDVFYQMTEKSWKNWVVQVLVANPLRWTLNKFKSTITGNNDSPATLIHLPTVQKLSQDILKTLPETSKEKLIDVNQMQDMFGIKNIEVLLLVLHWLESQKSVALQQNQSYLLIKFSKKENVTPKITEVDKALFSLEENKRMLETKIHSLEGERDHLLGEAKRHVAAKNMMMAKSTLRRKKTIENILQKLSDAVGNIESIIYQMQMAEMDSVILNCYETGVKTFNKFFKESGLTKDRILSTRDDLEEMLILKSDIDDALAESINGQALNESSEEFEEELKRLLEYDNNVLTNQIDTDSIAAKLPDVPSHEPASSGVEKLEKKIASLAL